MFFDIYCALCKERNTSPTGAALDMGLSRAAVSAWRNTNRTPQSAQLQKIASYFNVSVDYLLGNTKQKPAAESGEQTEKQLKVALFGGDGDVTEEMWDEVKNFAEYIKNKRK